MNHMFHFMTGLLSTFSLSCSLSHSGLGSLIVTQIVSLLGGVASAVLIAYLQHRWRGTHNDPNLD